MASLLNATTTGLGGIITTGDNSGSLALQTGGTTALTIDGSQNVMIGTTSAVQKFTVAGKTYFSNGVMELGIASTTSNAYVLQYLTSGSNYTAYIGVNGTAAGTPIDIGGISDNAVYFGARSNTSVQLLTNNTVRATLSSSGVLNLIATGGSTSAPNTALIVDYESGGALTTGGGTAIEFRGNSSGGGLANYQQARIRSIAQPTNNAHGLAFDYKPNAGTSLTEIMRIDTSGYVGIQTISPGAPLEVSGQIRISGGTAQALYLYGAASTAPYITINQYGIRDWNVSAGRYSSGTFSIQSGDVNGVYLGGTATSWASASDERFKDIIEPISNALTTISNLRSVIGKYKTDEEGTRRSFLIAQDIQQYFPPALEASNPDKLGVQYADVIPLLVASIKELNTLVTAQAELITALQAKVGE